MLSIRNLVRWTRKENLFLQQSISGSQVDFLMVILRWGDPSLVKDYAETIDKRILGGNKMSILSLW